MHDAVGHALLVWQLGLFAALCLHALATGSTVGRALALSTLGLVVVAALALLGAARGRAGYLDVALVVAMLGVAETLVITRTARRREDFR